MFHSIKLSDLIGDIDATISNRYYGKTFWIQAEITDVKKQPDKRWCFLKFIEKDGNMITTEIKGVFWSNSYIHIDRFEKETQQTFASGIEITCNVRIRFHKRFGLDLEVLEIDYAYAIGKLEIERKQILERLVRENPEIRFISEGVYATLNKSLLLPRVIQSVALITAQNSDGQRDFHKVTDHNKYGYAFKITPFLTQVQGDNAAKLIGKQLQLIEVASESVDAVVIVRGGGSDTDFKSFNDYELARQVAMFPIPIITGIGHDRNTSIVDMMTRQMKTPTDAANFIIDVNMSFESEIEALRDRLYQQVARYITDAEHELTILQDKLMPTVCRRMDKARYDISNYRQRVKNLNPATIFSKGFAMVMIDDKIVTDPRLINNNAVITTILKEEAIYSKVTKKESYGKQDDI